MQPFAIKSFEIFLHLQANVTPIKLQAKAHKVSRLECVEKFPYRKNCNAEMRMKLETKQLLNSFLFDFATLSETYTIRFNYCTIIQTGVSCKLLNRLSFLHARSCTVGGGKKSSSKRGICSLRPNLKVGRSTCLI